jgi:hypothetical protein
MSKVEIGYLCGRGHYVFRADPERDGSCDSRRIAGIFVEKDPDIEFTEPYEAKDEDGFVYFSDCGYSAKDYNDDRLQAEWHLKEVITAYRKS